MSFIAQLVAFTVGAVLAPRDIFQFAVTMFAWSLGQWVLVIPLALYFNKHGKSRTVNGLLILSFLGFLLSSICGAIGLVH